MVCKKCGTHYSDYDDQCPACGSFNPGGYSEEPEQKPEQKRPAQKVNNYQDNYAQQQVRRQQPQQQRPQPPRPPQDTVQYQRPVETVYIRDEGYNEDEHVSTWGWIGRWLIMCIPIVNVVMLFVWAFGGTPKRSLKTWARAQLLLVLIGILVTAIIVAILLATGYNFETIARYIRVY